MPPKKPSKSSVIDLTDDLIVDLVESHSTVSSEATSSSSDIAILRTLADNGLTTPLPPPQPALQIISSPIQPKNRNFRTSGNNLIDSEEVTVVKTVSLPTNRKKTLKPPGPIVIIPSDPPSLPVPIITERKCPVCFDTIRNPSVTLCGHVYCTECIKAAVGAAKQCPICRKKLTSKGFHPLYL